MTSQSQDKEIFTQDVIEYFKDQAEKIAKTGLAPAIALDAIGAFGNYGSLDSLLTLTPATAIGGMVGYYGGKNHWLDGPLLATVGYVAAKIAIPLVEKLKGGRIEEQQDLVKYLAAYALAAVAGKTVQYAKDNWKTKTKPALVTTGRGAGAATYATGKGIRDVTYAVGRGINYIESGIRNLVNRLFKKE